MESSFDIQNVPLGPLQAKMWVDSVQRGVNFAAKVLIYQSEYYDGDGERAGFVDKVGSPKKRNHLSCAV